MPTALSNPALLIYVSVSIVLILSILTACFRSVGEDKQEQEIMQRIEDKEKQLSAVDKKLDNRTKARSAKVIDTLDWMLSNGVIDSTEYNNLLVKSLPFI